MSWKCPNCGFDANADDKRDCAGGCGYIKLPTSVVLVSPVTGKQLRMSVDTAIGKYLLRLIVGDDAAFASDPQFSIRKDAALGAWTILHAPAATNPTWYNGAALNVQPQVLASAATISIGPEKAPLTVQFND